MPLEERLASAAPGVRAAAIDQVLARPGLVRPFLYAPLVGALWADGCRRQAAFWFYVFQARTRPWADADRNGDGAAALRASFDDELGTVINGWLGSDLAAWRDIARRAIAYEARLPLYAGGRAGRRHRRPLADHGGRRPAPLMRVVSRGRRAGWTRRNSPRTAAPAAWRSVRSTRPVRTFAPTGTDHLALITSPRVGSGRSNRLPGPNRAPISCAT